MTEKQEQILVAALELFAKNGFHATSTSKVAKHAGVSEGLIFRHFSNKQGLLEAISKQAEEKTQLMFSPIVFEENAKKRILLCLELPFNIDPSDFEFWKLQFKLKWELNTHYKQDKMKPLMLSLEAAFKELNYSNPEMEAQFILYFIEGISTSILRDTLPESEYKNMLRFLKDKYQV